MPRFIGVAAAAAVAVGCLTGAVAPAGAATAHPSSSLHAVHTAITAKTAPSFRVHLTHLPRGTRTYLQRRYGAAHRWHTVVRVRQHSGDVRAARLARGHYVFRLHTTRHGHTVVDSATRSVYSYGTVSLVALCRKGGVTATTTCLASPQSVPLGDIDSFTYDVQASGQDYPDFATTLAFSSTSCRSLRLAYAFSEFDDSNTLYLRVVQGSGVQRAQVSEGAVGHHTFTLTGGAFTLRTAAYESDNGFGALRGTASCWSGNGAG